jgi:hypothetical protein
MAILKKTKPDGGGLDTIRQQRIELVQRLARIEAEAATYDPLDQWEQLSKAATESQALERAIATADERITQAERQQQQEAAAAVEAARAERGMAAHAHVEQIAEQIAQQAQSWEGGLLSDLDAALRELAMVGGCPSLAVGQARSIRQAVGQALQRWRYVAPEWVGLPTPPTPRELALVEAKSDLERAEAGVAAVRAHRLAQRWDTQGPSMRESADQDAALFLVASRRRLYSLTDDAWASLPEDEQWRRLTAGLSYELSGLASMR